MHHCMPCLHGSSADRTYEYRIQLASLFLSAAVHNGDKSSSWEVGVISGPHADPDFITSAFMETFHSSPYKVRLDPIPDAPS